MNTTNHPEPPAAAPSFILHPPSSPLSPLWSSLTRLGLAAVTHAWRRELGPVFDHFRPFLKPTTELSPIYPCTRQPPCDCWHEIREAYDGGLIATCACDDADCAPIPLDPADALLYAIAPAPFAAALRQAFNAHPPYPPSSTLHPLLPLATWGPAQIPLFFVLAPSPDVLLRTLLALGPGPFILCTPVEIRNPDLIKIQSERNILPLPLSKHLALDGPGRFKLLEPIAPILESFQRKLAHPSRLESAIAQIHQDLHAVAHQQSALRRENEELKQLQAEGYFRFALRVDAEDFRIFAAIMALGNRAAAARALAIPRRSFYNQVERWAKKSPDCQRMFRLVEWRAAQNRNIKVRLEDSLLSGEPGDTPENPETIQDVLTKLHDSAADNRSYPDLLREILELLARQAPANWQKIQTEALDILKEEIG